MKKFAQFRQISKMILPIARILLLVPVGSQKYRKILVFSYFHISTCGQIWLNHFPDDSHLSYITKLEKETLAGTPVQGEPATAPVPSPSQRRPLRANEEMLNLDSVTLI
jgi:hypothetical protein